MKRAEQPVSNLQDKQIPGLHKNTITQFSVMVCVLQHHYFGYCPLSSLEYTKFRELALHPSIANTILLFYYNTWYLQQHAKTRKLDIMEVILTLWVQKRSTLLQKSAFVTVNFTECKIKTLLVCENSLASSFMAVISNYWTQDKHNTIYR